MITKRTLRSTNPSEGSPRELRAARDIAHAFLTATRPAEVYRLALERVTPLVGAAFGCVFAREGDSDLLRVVAAHNWPRTFAAYLDEMRVRVGNGPTGQAVAESRTVEVPDVFADPAVQDWWEAARELGFAASISLPLVQQGEPMGALTFYFREPGSLGAADQNLLRLVADQLSATAEKAHLIEDLRNANTQLREQNVELEARYREAMEARRLKAEFLANISHELRTPLSAIMGFTHLLREGISGDLTDDQSSSVERIESAAASLHTMIGDLLDLTHVKLGRLLVENEPCDAVALLRAALSTAPPSSVPTPISTEAPPDPVPLRTDPVLALRILGNLVSNALKFAAGSSVTVRVRTEPEDGLAERVVWEVEDTGIGIAPEHHETVFDEFRQVDGSATRRFGGAGLGLALSKRVAQRLGGDILLHSVAGEGAMFSFVLPVRPPNE